MRGSTLENSATLIWDADNDGDNDDGDGVLTDSRDVTVVTPELLVEKAVSVIPSDTGDPLQYTIVIRHSDVTDAPVPVSGSDAYDITFTDVLPAGIDAPAIVSALDSAGVSVPGFVLSGNTISHAGFDLAGPAITEGTTVLNSAGIGWSTLDDDSDDGRDSGETTGSDSDNATFTLSEIVKTVTGTGINDSINDNNDVVVGEFVDYRVVVELPKSVATLAEVVDVLDSGLVFDTDHGVSVTASSANVSTSLGDGDFSSITASYDIQKNTISIPLGTVVNSTAASNVETLTIDYRVYVENHALATPGTALNNAVSFRWDIDGDGQNNSGLDGVTSTDAPDVIVVEPQLQLQKSIIVMPGESGDAITYQFNISHTAASGSSAYDVTFSDLLPEGVSELVIDSAVDGNNNPVSGFIVNGSTIEHPGFDLQHGETVKLIVSAQVNNLAVAGGTIDNTATIVWGSLDAGNPDDGADAYSPVAELQQSSTDSDSFSIADVQKYIVSTGINSTHNSNNQAVVGEYITYQLTIAVPQGTTSIAEIRDTLGHGLAFDSLQSVMPGSTALTTDFGVGDFSDILAPAPNTTGQIVFPLGTITNIDQDNTNTETLEITYRVYVTNDSALQRGSVLGNNATLHWDIDNDGAVNEVTSAAAPPVTVIQPVIGVSKSIDDPAPHLGQTMVCLLAQTVTLRTFPMETQCHWHLTQSAMVKRWL